MLLHITSCYCLLSKHFTHCAIFLYKYASLNTELLQYTLNAENNCEIRVTFFYINVT